MMKNDISKILFSEECIQNRIQELADVINEDYKNKDLMLLCILKGSVIFMADLMKKINLYAVTEFMCVSSYGNSTTSTGNVRILKDLDMPVNNKHILIVEDIIDTGTTLKYVSEYLLGKGAESVEVVTLLDKPSGRKVDIDAKYVGFEVGNEFVIGYGLDYAEKYRNLPYIGVLNENMYKS